jgi:hypothetical protein
MADDLSWIDHPANLRANAALLRAIAEQSLLHADEIERLRAEVVRYRGILTSLKVEWHD